jgi:hypothetical protein
VCVVGQPPCNALSSSLPPATPGLQRSTIQIPPTGPPAVAPTVKGGRRERR